MGSGTLCLSCILRKENPAPQARIACGADQPAFMPRIKARRILWGVVRFVRAVTGVRTAPPVRAEEGAGSACRAGQPAFMPRIKARRFLWEVGTLCLGCNWHKDSPAPQARIACGFNPRRGMGAGSACGAEEGAGSACPARRLSFSGNGIGNLI